MNPCPRVRRLTALLATLAPFALPPAALAAAPESAWVEFDSFRYQGRDPVFEAAPPAVGEYYNPIVAGYYPDPSICRVGDDFYLINSSFSFFPGIPVFHSRDLVNWTQLGHVLERPSQLDLDGLPVSSGIYAPAIEHHDGLFYVITTNVRGIGNFYVTAKDPAGPWSDPITLPIDGIDPSFFFDDGGRAYVVHNGPPPDNNALYNGHRAIWLWEFDPASRTVKNGRIIVDGGSDIREKPVWVEGPHIFKRKGWYYLSCAEGGTGPNHSQVIFRTRKLSEPFVPAPQNPILTQRDLDAKRPDPVIALGHADLVETASGEWWAVFLGVRPYEQGKSNIGRETFLLPVTWKNDWPGILEKGRVLPNTLARPALPASPRPTPPTTGSFTWRDDFDAPQLGLPWLFLRTPRERWWSLSARPGSLLVEPRAVGLDSVEHKDTALNANPSFIARRLQHVDFQSETTLEIRPETLASDAGLAALQNDTNYLFLGVRVRDGRAREVFLERRDKSTPEAGIVAQQNLPANARHLELRISGVGKLLTFAYRFSEDAAWQVLAADLDGSLLSTQDAGGFVGAVVGLYARLPVEVAASTPQASATTTPPSPPAPAVAVPDVPLQDLGEIPVRTMRTGPTDAWQPSFAGGALALDAFEAFGPQGPLSHLIPSQSGLLQSFRGNGQKLKGVAFCFAGTAAPASQAKYRLTLIDYGVEDPTRTATTLNTRRRVLAAGTFALPDYSGTSQQYFDLSSADITLAPDHRYGLALHFIDATRASVIYRSVVDALPEGRLAFGAPGAYAFNFAGGDRDAHFALYSIRR